MTPLWFAGWQPKTAGTTFAACLGLFGLAILSKLLGALRHQAHLAWSKLQWEELNANDQTLDKSDKPDTVTESLKKGCRRIGPWTPEHDIPRGILAALHSGLDYFLMVRSLLLLLIRNFQSRLTRVLYHVWFSACCNDVQRLLLHSYHFRFICWRSRFW